MVSSLNIILKKPDLILSMGELKEDIFNMLEFPISEFITLRLEEGKTNIYINNNLFRQCISLIFTVPTDHLNSLDYIKSIDEIKEINSKFKDSQIIEISPETEFWGHCSNIQAWVENDYNTDLIDSELAFPLLEELVKLGDSDAKYCLKSEIIRKIEARYIPSIYYLLAEKLILRFFTKEEISFLMNTIYEILSQSLENFYKKDCLTQGDFTFETLALLKDFYNESKAEKIFKNAIKKIIEKGFSKSTQVLIDFDYRYFYDYFSEYELLELLFLKNSPYTKSIFRFFEKNSEYRSFFIRNLRYYRYYDKKRKKLKGDSGEFVKSYIINIISLIIESNFDGLKNKLKETIKKNKGNFKI